MKGRARVPSYCVLQRPKSSSVRPSVRGIRKAYKKNTRENSRGHWGANKFESNQSPLAEQDAGETRYQTPKSGNPSRLGKACTIYGRFQPLQSEQPCQKYERSTERDDCTARAIMPKKKIRSAVFGIDGLVSRSLYRTRHFLWSLLRLLRDRRAARVACSNTSRTPSLVLAEHSRYL